MSLKTIQNPLSRNRLLKPPKQEAGHHQPCCQPPPRTTGPLCITVNPSNTDSSSDEDISETEMCCVCKLFQPKQLQHFVSLVLTNWVQCDDNNCNHWTHLKVLLQTNCSQTSWPEKHGRISSKIIQWPEKHGRVSSKIIQSTFVC